VITQEVPVVPVLSAHSVKCWADAAPIPQELIVVRWAAKKEQDKSKLISESLIKRLRIFVRASMVKAKKLIRPKDKMGAENL
jgi:hypothetical protein